MECPECGADMGEPVGKTFCNHPEYKFVKMGEHTGNIYKCENCKEYWLDNFINGFLERWTGG